MIVLDTNVASEAMKPDPDPAVRAWLNEQVTETLYLSSLTVAELMFGIAALPAGKRRELLTMAFDGLLGFLKNRVLPFDFAAARQYAELAAAARANGRGFRIPDGYIAAIAKANGFSVASRDTAPFDAAKVDVINPWQE